MQTRHDTGFLKRTKSLPTTIGSTVEYKNRRPMPGDQASNAKGYTYTVLRRISDDLENGWLVTVTGNAVSRNARVRWHKKRGMWHIDEFVYVPGDAAPETFRWPLTKAMLVTLVVVFIWSTLILVAHTLKRC